MNDALLQRVTSTAVDPALAILPGYLDSMSARVMLLAIGLQESGLTARRQRGFGPARGLWQFELGGGVRGVFNHTSSHVLLHGLCKAQACGFDPSSIYGRIEVDDVLAAGVARLLLWTDPQPLPDLGDVDGAWRLYAFRLWRPGKPRPQHWRESYERALEFVKAANGLVAS